MIRREFELARVDDFGARLEDRLPAGLYERPRLRALMRAIGHGLQIIEDDLHDQTLALTLDGANDEDLDVVGRIVGEPRLGLIDVDYRRFIAGRLLARKSRGTPSELTAILEVIAAPCIAVHYDMFAAGFRLYFGRSTPLSDELLGRVRRFMVAVKPAGVTMLLVEYTASPVGFESPAAATAAGFASGALSRQLYP